ncbi:ABC transporter ATP-binding protein [Rhodococcus koreensis]|uniref:Amino acid/amide ABC transporter ATP-binding protein 2, HAAT family n=1 Tax=Rhodococcus koreensis TaxID=99653 RepID=A0A1H4KZF1_9NOCA|nr:ABC transporter ATP-binding protein [Rhodococcus koreensis]SEB63890.1 amino acid/amide ABC transporter ATP-binding protein 2, HAAT family [Rhodococcus koreensis]
MLKIENVRVSYNGIDAVHGVSLEVSEGEAVALLGPNGAGKSSTLKAIVGAVASTGRIEFDGGVYRRQPDALARAGLMLVPEGRHLFKSMTAHENIQVGESARRGRSGPSVDDIYELFPALVPLRDRASWALSGGEQQMVAVGRALAGGPRMLLLDEPSMGLAPLVISDMYKSLAQIRDSVTILCVEQNTQAALKLCQRAYVMANGEIQLEATAAELAGQKRLMDSYMGRKDVGGAVEDKAETTAS